MTVDYYIPSSTREWTGEVEVVTHDDGTQTAVHIQRGGLRYPLGSQYIERNIRIGYWVPKTPPEMRVGAGL